MRKLLILIVFILSLLLVKPISTSFRILKQVRVNNGIFSNKVYANSGDTLEFKIVVTNTSDSGKSNDINLKDYLPHELISNSSLVFHWDNFKVGESKVFTIIARINPQEFIKPNFEKCVVNKVEVDSKGKYGASDIATVCYKKETKIRCNSCPCYDFSPFYESHIFRK